MSNYLLRWIPNHDKRFRPRKNWLSCVLDLEDAAIIPQVSMISQWNLQSKYLIMYMKFVRHLIVQFLSKSPKLSEQTLSDAYLMCVLIKLASLIYGRMFCIIHSFQISDISGTIWPGNCRIKSRNNKNERCLLHCYLYTVPSEKIIIQRIQ